MFLSFYCCVALHCLCVFLFVHSFASWRLFRLFPDLCDYEWNFCKHSCEHKFFFLMDKYLEIELLGPMCVCVLLFSHCHVQLFATPWTPLSFTISQSLLKFMPTESVMPSNHLIICCFLLLLHSVFPASGSFPMSQLFTSGSQSIGASTLATVLPMNIQDWFLLGLTGLISLQSKGLSKMCLCL